MEKYSLGKFYTLRIAQHVYYPFIKNACRVVTCLNLFGDSELSFSYRSLPEPLMTYELHGDFIVPASKYYAEMHSFVVGSMYKLKFPRKKF